MARGALDVVLIRDEHSSIVFPNENLRGYREGWAGDGDVEHLYPRFVEGKGSPVATCYYDLGLTYSLHQQNRYKLLGAVNLAGDVNALVVAKPIEFVLGNSETGNRPTLQVGSGAMRTSEVPRQSASSADGDWSVLSRFAGKPFDGLVLEASLNSASSAASSPAQLTLTLRNQSKRPTLVVKWDSNSDYVVLVRDPAGSAVRLTERGKVFFGKGRILKVCEMRSGEVTQAILPLSELFGMNSPGDYTVLASLPVIGDVDAVLTAAPIKVHIDGPTQAGS